MVELILVTTDDCHLCERARTVLDALGIEAREIALASPDAETLVASGISLAFLPVLSDGTRAIAYGRFSEKRLRKELATEPAA